MAFIGATPTPIPLTATDIPDLPATKITSGTFPALNGSNLTNLDASDLTGTLPAISGANLTNVSAGKLHQVVQAVNSTTFTGTSNSYSACGDQIQITPSASDSKILVAFGHNIWRGGHNGNIFGTIYRTVGGSATQLVGGRGLHQSNGYVRAMGGSADTTVLQMTFYQYLDTPSTTSQITYENYFRNESGSNTFEVGEGAGHYTYMTAMEILA